ncbi:MAG: asparagine synthetase B, partial [Oligoflexia bacterium]|nr:asparagine synthetase B [Oligoflexia bacterium]
MFASEIKSIFKYPGIKKIPNDEKIFRYLSYNYRYIDIDESSYFENIFQVPKSHIVEIDEQLNIKKTPYWSLDKKIKSDDYLSCSENQIIKIFQEKFFNAIKIRLRSDVPVGCMLSGGLDSTSITCVAYKIFNKPIVTFSGITGDIKGVYDESDFINEVIKETHANY